MNTEYKIAQFDEIRKNLQKIQAIYGFLRADGDSTAKQRRAITRASDELTSYETVCVANLKKTMRI